MARQGKTQLTYVIVCPPEEEAEGDRIFRSHAAWMEATHHRSGDRELHLYDVSKAPELSNPFDPSSPPTGNTCFILSEVYESDNGAPITSNRPRTDGRTSRRWVRGWRSAR